MTRLDELTIYQFYILKGQFNVLTLVFDEGGKKKKKVKKEIYNRVFGVFQSAQSAACVHKVFGDDGELWMAMVVVKHDV